MAWGIGVDVTWPGNHRRGVLTDNHPTSSRSVPVLIIDGQAYTPYDLTPDIRITAKWLQPRRGPMWSIIQKAIDAGYPIEVDPVESLVGATPGRGA